MQIEGIESFNDFSGLKFPITISSKGTTTTITPTQMKPEYTEENLKAAAVERMIAARERLVKMREELRNTPTEGWFFIEGYANANHLPKKTAENDVLQMFSMNLVERQKHGNRYEYRFV